MNPEFILAEILISLLALMLDISIATLINLIEKHKPVKCLHWKRPEVLGGAYIPAQFAFISAHQHFT